jgi:hypothetical protein
VDVEDDPRPPRRRLPNAERAFVEPAKLANYLLNPDHTHGGDKATYLLRFGFRRDAWHVLLAALLVHARDGDVVAEQQKTFGRHFAVEGPIVTPDGRNPIVRTVSMVRFEEDQPRSLTAFPARRRSGERAR